MTTTITSAAEAFVRFERDGWSRVAEGYHRFFSPVTGRVADDLLDAAHVDAGRWCSTSPPARVSSLPGPAARGASVFGLHPQQHLIAPAVPVEPCGKGEHSDPCVGAGEFEHLPVQLLGEGLYLGLALFLVPLASVATAPPTPRVGHHATSST